MAYPSLVNYRGVGYCTHAAVARQDATHRQGRPEPIRTTTW